MLTRQGDVAARRPGRFYALPGHSALDRAEEELFTQGSLATSRTWFDRAHREARASGCPQALARAALGMSGLWVHERRLAAEAAAVEAHQRQALAQVGSDSVLGLRLSARLAAEACYQTGDPSGVLELLDDLRGCGDPLALAEGLSVAHHCILGPDHAGLRRRLAGELLQVAAATGRTVDVLMGLLWRTVDLFLDGDPTAERSLTELRAAWAQENLAVGFVVRSLDVMLAIRSARWADAEELVAECAERGARAGDADASTWAVAQLMAIRWFQGRGVEMLAHLAQLAVSTSIGAVDRASFATLALALALSGDRPGAACALARVRGLGFAELVRTSGWLVGMYAVVETAYLLGDAQLAAEAYAQLLPFAELPMMTSLAVACFGSTHHALGVAALTRGDADLAVGHLDAAVRANQALGHRPAVVLSEYRLAEALGLRCHPGDDERSGATRARADVAGSRLGVSPPARHTGWVGEHPGAAPEELVMTRGPGAAWQVRLGRRSVTVSHSVGMGYIAMLVERPGEDVPATALVLASAGHAPASNGAGAAQSVLDARATREYRARLRELQTELEAHEQAGDIGRAERARSERDWLLRELVSATGPGGRLRLFADDGERARVAVTKAIRRGVARVSAADGQIGAELGRRLQTGKHCCFAAT